VASNLHNIVLKINEAAFLLVIIDIGQNLTKLLQELQVVILTGYSVHLMLIYPLLTESLHT